ncbi:MAG: ATP-binding protein [Thermodesulfovibrionales bacterium]
MLIKREIFPELLEQMARKEITLIVGPRQAGKTTLMNLLKEELIKRGEKTLFMSLDFERDMPSFRSQQAIIERLNLEFGSKKAYVFIDEIQRKKDAGLFIKGIYDMNLPYKFIISGSGSLELEESIHESLIGRKRLFELNTLSLKEFINFKTGYKYEDRLKEFFKIEDRLKEFFKIDPLAKDLFLEYMNFGGYPRVVLEERLDQKIAVIDDIYRSYIEKDISFLLR